MQNLSLNLSDFEAIRKANLLYVDKTDMIEKLVKDPSSTKILLRPSGFGKTLLLSAIESLFKNGLEYFEGLKIEKLWEEKKTYQTVRLDFAELKDLDSIEGFEKAFSSEVEEKFGPFGFEPQYRDFLFSIEFSSWLEKQKNCKYVLLIDNYDVALIRTFGSEPLFKGIPEDMGNFLAVLKSMSHRFRCCILTGTFNFAYTGIFECFNHAENVTLDPWFSDICGFSQVEVGEYFVEPLSASAIKMEKTVPVLEEELCQACGGFSFDRKLNSRLLRPDSLLSFLSDPGKGFSNYGHPFTEEARFLKGFAQEKNSGSKDRMDKEKYFDLTGWDGLWAFGPRNEGALLTQAGLLALKEVHGDFARVDFPNAEARHVFGELFGAG